MLASLNDPKADHQNGETTALTGSSAQSRLRILIAEDNAINQKVASRMLEKHGHEVVVVSNGIEAVDAMGQNAFDAVLMDVQMPEMNGLDATRTFRNLENGHGRRQFIIAMTGHTLAGDREQCIAAGMDDYIAKPINPEELLRLLNRVARRLPAST